MAEEESTIILVNEDRVLFELDLQRLNFKKGALVTPEEINSPYQPYCFRKYIVSNDGCRVVGLYMSCPKWSDATTYEDKKEQLASLDSSKTRMELKFLDSSGTPDWVQTLELEYSDPESPVYHDHVITFSPDISMLQAGPHIFDLLAPGNPRLVFPDSPLDKFRHGENSCIFFSACNCYLIAIQDKDGVATFGIFRIARTAGMIERISVTGLDDLAADRFRAAFHPVLPLLLLTCITRQEKDVEDVSQTIKVLEIDMEALKFAQIDIPPHQPPIFEK